MVEYDSNTNNDKKRMVECFKGATLWDVKDLVNKFLENKYHVYELIDVRIAQETAEPNHFYATVIFIDKRYHKKEEEEEDG